MRGVRFEREECEEAVKRAVRLRMSNEKEREDRALDGRDWDTLIKEVCV